MAVERCNKLKCLPHVQLLEPCCGASCSCHPLASNAIQRAGLCFAVLLSHGCNLNDKHVSWPGTGQIATMLHANWSCRCLTAWCAAVLIQAYHITL